MKKARELPGITPGQEAALDSKIDQHFRSQRELPSGRNFLWNTYRFKDERDIDNYRKNFDDIFPNAPGAGI